MAIWMCQQMTLETSTTVGQHKIHKNKRQFTYGIYTVNFMLHITLDLLGFGPIKF